MRDAPTRTRLPTWHEGELALQRHVGVAEKMDGVGKRVVRDHMPDQHRAFYAQLPFLLAGSVDGQGDAWATVLEGQPGFTQSPSPTSLRIDARPAPSDPAGAGMRDGDAIGLLGIELHTRRRNRVNGTLRAAGPGALLFEVDQSFGNCPRYIQLRDFTWSREPGQAHAGSIDTGTALDDGARAMIEAADAFFVASYADREDRRQVDVSHRGGKAGFVRVEADGTLVIPDFNGNLFFNTLGNILLNGKAGLTFIDFRNGDLLQMTGDAEVLLDSPEIAAFQGAERLWTFRPRRVVRRGGALALRWAMQDEAWSPASLMTGDWAQAAQRLRAAELATRWRPYSVTRIVEESATVRSFHLRPADDAGLLPHAAGQHLPIRVALPGADKPVIRTYTLSRPPSDGEYRISVRRAGAVSAHLHDTVRVGDIIEARAPGGAFTLDVAASRPAVLLAGGIGITPLLAMLGHVVYEGLRRQAIRPTTLFYATRDAHDRPFQQELDALARAGRGAIRVIRVVSRTDGAQAGQDYDATGRIDMALLSQHLAFNDYDFYLCGPPGFSQSLYDGLRHVNVADDRIHAEAFGPAALTRTASAASRSDTPKAVPATQSVPVIFTASLKEARWEPASGSLLDLAEARGLAPEFSCREGSCGTCKTRLLAGAVAYPVPPSAAVAEDEVLICCAVPAHTEGDAPRLQLAL